MSFGRLCEHCKQGRVRPFQFNWKQAVVTCDNADCELRLDVSPWDCIVDHPLRSRTHHSSSKGSSFVGSQSSSSSSGIQSDLRSPVLSPFTSPSYESVTDKEVENLLKRTLGPEYLKKSHSPETKNTLPECPEVLLDSEQQNQSQTQGNDTFDSFFELLNNLDSEFPSTSVKGDYVSFNQKNVNEENIFESVTSELESLMNSIESPSKIIKDDLQEENAVVKQEVQCIDFDKKIKNHSLVDNRVYIPSKSSAFSEVSPKKDIVADYSFACSLSDTLLTEPRDNLVPGFEKVDNIARTDLSICDAQFLSPATSAVSDDSGYEDNAVRVNSVLPPPLSQVECGRDSSSKVSLVVRENGGERQAQTLQNSQKVLKLSEMVASPQAKEAAPNVPPVSSHVEHAATIIDETDKMEIEDKGGHSSSSYPPIEGDSNCSCSFVPNDRVLSEDCFQKSSQLSSYVASPSSLNIQPIAENHLADSPNLASSECAHTSEGPSEISNDASLNDEEDSTQTTNICTEEVRHQKKRGRPRGSWSRPTQRVGVKRKQRVTKTKLTMVEEEKVNSLKKGLNQLLQTPSLQFRRDENGNQNITTLGLRNRLNVKYSFSL
ncbi:hypothetical protein SK128_012791 [Halocaridina rubra]|uniref:Uncharacterized protein n=1 Tax=Halocaridina rubra TaxID=373956 RepID=A0AAN8X048_HALRR